MQAGCTARCGAAAPAAAGRLAPALPGRACAASALRGSSPRVPAAATTHAGVRRRKAAPPAVVASAASPRPAAGAAAAASGLGGATKMASLMSTTDSWRLLKAHAQEDEMPHLRELMADAKRCEKMFAAHDGITLDYSRQARRGALRPRRCGEPEKAHTKRAHNKGGTVATPGRRRAGGASRPRRTHAAAARAVTRPRHSRREAPHAAARADRMRILRLARFFCLRFAQRATARTMSLLFRLAEEAKVAEKIEAMFAGAHLNTTEDRAVRSLRRARR
jgi:hypothetical protein